jgi:hypothetical protein
LPFVFRADGRNFAPALTYHGTALVEAGLSGPLLVNACKFVSCEFTSTTIVGERCHGGVKVERVRPEFQNEIEHRRLPLNAGMYVLLWDRRTDTEGNRTKAYSDCFEVLQTLPK